MKLTKLREQYGHGWYFKRIVPICKFNGIGYVKKEDIHKIQNYKAERSKYETELYELISSTYKDKIYTNYRKLIGLELDFYLPKLKLAIEFNGTYWHSIENGTPKDYHYQKSVLCREKQVRLIHIYEFEDFEEQKKLLLDFLNGNDNYGNDPNKNNFLNLEVAQIHKDKYTVYGLRR